MRDTLRGTLVLLVLLALPMSAGCKRGCLAAFVRESSQSSGGERPTGPRAITQELGGVTDCPDGLARCSGGSVEVSRLGAAPGTGTCAPGKACGCPWDLAGTCSGACAVEGAVVAMPKGRALVQLCAPGPGSPFATPGSLVAGGEERGCGGEVGLLCRKGVVFRCGEDLAGHPPPPVVLAGCLAGCAAEDAVVDDEPAGTSVEGAVAILCARSAAP